MGAFNLHPSQPERPKTRPGIVIFAAVLVLVLLALKWHDVVELVNGEYRLKPKYQRELERKLDADDQAEQYALVAVEDGWYPCTHSGFTRYYLRTGEVWRYGSTSKGQLGRYKMGYFRKNRVEYVIQFVGTENQCKKEEQLKLRNYPLLPENLARPEEYRLIRPPYNPIWR